MSDSEFPDRDPLEEAADATLASRAVDGDTHAFEVLARRHGPLMRIYSAKLLDSDIESDDVVQEAFLTGWRQIGDLDSPANVRNWLMRIVTRKAIDRIRVRRSHDDIDDWDPPAPPETSPERVVIARLQMDAGVGYYERPQAIATKRSASPSGSRSRPSAACWSGHDAFS